jgi:hypothetical protein
VALHGQGPHSLLIPCVAFWARRKSDLQLTVAKGVNWQIPTIHCKVPWFLVEIREFWAEFAKIGFLGRKIR